MPWKVVKRNNNYVVINSETKRAFGRHKTKSMANRQLRAINANYKSRSRRSRARNRRKR